MRILFITSSRIGDAVLSSGLLDHLRKAHPQARFTIVAGPAAAPLFTAFPALERIIPLPKRRFRMHWVALWRELAGIAWEIIVDLRRSAVSYLLRRGVLHRMPNSPPGLHAVQRFAATLDMQDAPPAPAVWTGPADERIAAAKIPAGGPVLGIGPTANWPGKIWPCDRFAELALRLTGRLGALPGARIAVFGGPDERGQIGRLFDRLGDRETMDIFGVSLTEAAACLRRCRLFVGNDSGLMHLAAACGTPTLGLFGPSQTKVYAPWGDLTAAVRTPESYEELISGPGYDHRTTGSLMHGLTVDTAEAAAIALWRRVTEPAR